MGVSNQGESPTPQHGKAAAGTNGPERYGRLAVRSPARERSQGSKPYQRAKTLSSKPGGRAALRHEGCCPCFSDQHAEVVWQHDCSPWLVACSTRSWG